MLVCASFSVPRLTVGWPASSSSWPGSPRGSASAGPRCSEHLCKRQLQTSEAKVRASKPASLPMRCTCAAHYSTAVTLQKCSIPPSSSRSGAGTTQSVGAVVGAIAGSGDDYMTAVWPLPWSHTGATRSVCVHVSWCTRAAVTSRGRVNLCTLVPGSAAGMRGYRETCLVTDGDECERCTAPSDASE